MGIEVKNLTKTFGSQVAVNDISFDAQSGRLVGFLGPNGAGKSTTMKMITGFLQPDTGEIFVDGIAVKENPLEARRRIGYLPENNPLYYDMYVREYLKFIADLHKISQKKERIDEVIHQIGLEKEKHKKIGALSKGYKQRVGLAAAIIHQPAVLILDEPTSGLDPNQIVEIRQVIRDYARDHSVLLSTHIMQEVEAICDDVLIINQGNLISDSSLEQLKKSRGKGELLVQFKEPLESQWMERLPSVASVDKIDTYRWRIQTTDAEAAKSQLMEMSLKNNLHISSLQEGSSLEGLFQALTKKADEDNLAR